MKGMMMHRPLKIADLITFAADTYPAGEIVSVRTEGDIHRTTYKETAGRIARLAHGLKALGIAESDRVATLAWNATAISSSIMQFPASAPSATPSIRGFQRNR